MTYTYTTKARVADMVDLTEEARGTTPLKIVWSCYIGGPAGYSVQDDVNRMKAAVDQAFVQSPYLAKTAANK